METEELLQKLKEKIWNIMSKSKNYNLFNVKTKDYIFAKNDVGAKEIVDKMIERAIKEKIAGISDTTYSIIVVGDPWNKESFFAIINPRIITVSSVLESKTERCSEFPGLELKVARPDKIWIEYADVDGRRDKYVYSGLTARIILHEYDSLCEIPFTERVSKLRLDMARKKRSKKKKRKILKNVGQDFKASYAIDL
jgi:peptide deformylase